MTEIKKTVKDYILAEFLPGEDPVGLTDDTPLITGGILDSIATIKTSEFLQEKYRIKIAAHEMTAKHFNTIASMASLIQSKLQLQ